MRPNLTNEISVQDFYWLKEELQSFCRENGISASGSKIEISDSVETFLQIEEIKKTNRNSKANNKSRNNSELSLDTVITENHRCRQ